jgi:pimeloyl-ACP methyl ester carboxylesterase
MSDTVRYARSGDLNIAFQVTDGGSLDLVLVPGFVSHLEMDWEEPRSRYFLERLGSFSRLIRFDKRGTGLSDRDCGLPDLETRMDDVRTVLDAVGSEQAALFGYSEGGPLCCLFAASHPERTSALVLYGTYAKRHDPDDDYPWAPTWEERQSYADEIERGWAWEADLKRMAPSADSALTVWWGRRARAAASPGAARALILMNSEIDVRSVLPSVHVPTLVLHRDRDRDAVVDEGRYIAQHIPGAEFVELSGEDHIPWLDADQILDPIEEFLTGMRSERRPDRILATILLTDIVGSTEQAATIGDHAWRSRLTQYRLLVRSALENFQGREVDAAGDGFLALFDGPARAIRCARQIVADVQALGIELRAGLHTGECELMEDGVSGIAVHIGARVAAQAGAGEVLVSRTVRDIVAGSGIDFTDRGHHRLKGVDGEWQLFAVD